MPLGLTPAAAATDAAIPKKSYGSGVTTLVISNEEMDDIIKIITCFEESGLLIKGGSDAIKNEVKKNKKEAFLAY